MRGKAIDKKEKDKLSSYGKLVCDFANAKNIDDLLTSFFANFQSAFNFSNDFKEKTLKIYPPRQMIIDNLSEDERELVELFLE